ncbi:Crp/Fnr family transcriptional regulator [Rhizobium sp. P32RR-XVIII]|uniref:Crp/Fnr family transcriptional regulator n=1 Tax=Rhizobium sp. P32RR-XVIII TaxID=2726738 RepID=UPI001FED8C31|nr:Crp/Fnr family transcriptional regulator [Rhizobium sp. P32RR-XVIII]
MPTEDRQYRNALLKSMDAKDLALLAPHLEHVTLDIPYEIEKAHEPADYVVFLESGLASIVARLSGGRDIEVGIAGREGMTGAAIVLGGEQSPNMTFMQVSGSGFRISSAKLQEAIDASSTLRARLLAYIQAFMAQMSSTVLANGHSKLEERLARWLLMVHDRMDGNTISLTHEFLSIMLGVRRPGVTVAVHILEGKGYIRANRGQITILNRKGLIEEANGSYGAAEEEYLRLIGTPLSRQQ